MADTGLDCSWNNLTIETIIRALFTVDATGKFAIRTMDNAGCVNDVPCDMNNLTNDDLWKLAIGVNSCGKLALRLANPNSTTAASGYKVYTALLSQAGTAAPTKKVLKNTIGDGTGVGVGDLVWTRVSAGTYKVTMTGAFTANKTWMIITSTGSFLVSTDNVTGAPNDKYVYTRDPGTGTASDGLLNDTSIEIRVYA